MEPTRPPPPTTPPLEPNTKENQPLKTDHSGHKWTRAKGPGHLNNGKASNQMEILKSRNLAEKPIPAPRKDLAAQKPIPAPRKDLAAQRPVAPPRKDLERKTNQAAQSRLNLHPNPPKKRLPDLPKKTRARTETLPPDHHAPAPPSTNPTGPKKRKNG